MRERKLEAMAVFVFGAAALLALAGPVGCASSGAGATASAAERPADPFSEWVEKIQPGLTRHEDIRERFGPPDSLERRWDGGARWCYHHAELLGEAGITPEEAARDASRARAVLAASRRGSRSLVDWWSRAFFYPPRRPKPPPVERVPALLHELEIAMKADGVVENVRYHREQTTLTVPKK